VTEAHTLQEDLLRSRRELEVAYEELQSTVEELETTNEELQSTNEELETTNEELQSTNEELETMNEELQSTNEELETMNEELRLRSTELNHVNAFLETVLGATRLGVIIVGQDGRIQAWDSRSEELWGLRAEEVIGRDLDGLDIGLPVSELRETILAPDGTDGHHEALVVAARNRRGAPIACRITVTPVETDDPELSDGTTILLVEEIEKTATEPAPELTP
jgi:two-component system CheB/CheR fusion protein